MSIGTNIYTLRKARKITQTELAEKLGVSEQAVSHDRRLFRSVYRQALRLSSE